MDSNKIASLLPIVEKVAAWLMEEYSPPLFDDSEQFKKFAYQEQAKNLLKLVGIQIIPSTTPASNSPLAPINGRLDTIEQVLQDAGLMPASAPAPVYATVEQKKEIIRLLNLPPITRPQKTKGLLNINKLTEAAAADYLVELRRATSSHDHGKDSRQPGA